MNQTVVKITIGSHFFKLTHIHPSVKTIINDFARRYIKFKLVKDNRGSFKRTPDAVFGAATANREEYRFHINQYQEFRDLLKMKNYTDNLLDIVVKPIPLGISYEFDVKDIWVPRDYQIPVIEYFCAPDGSRSRIVEIQTGKGKTFSALYSLSKVGVRFAILLRPMYIGKWVEDLQKIYNISPTEIMVVQGGKSLQALLHLAVTGGLDNIKVIIISNKTYQSWLSTYEDTNGETVELGYPIHPEDFFETIGCGVRLIDEIHLDLHLQFKTDLYTNIFRSFALSATFFSNDRFVEHVQEIMYPLDTRYKGGELDKYVIATACFYSIKNMRNIRTKERGSESYSHIAFEKSIRRDNIQLANYLRMTKHLVDEFFMCDYVPGQRCAVFAASIDMCTIMVNSLRKAYPHLNINRFAEDDPDENLYQSDISVTTVQSGGTAHDIDKLKAVIMTNSLDSKASNVQTLGRLRYNSTMVTRFAYLVCTDIPKQMDYHYKKVTMLEERAKAYREYVVPIAV